MYVSRPRLLQTGSVAATVTSGKPIGDAFDRLGTGIHVVFLAGNEESSSTVLGGLHQFVLFRVIEALFCELTHDRQTPRRVRLHYSSGMICVRGYF